jgi:redox-sensitive bicupin YhaK (pirin superfamily)
MTDDLVLQTVELGPSPSPWATVDPFLFCVHHHDRYPAGDGRLGPASPLAGRDIGQDFSARDGWSMYHGSHVPGFPQHPHRGFETVTIVRRGLVDHSDSLGAAARFGRGDVQWLTAGSGIVHAEMFPLFDTDGDNPLELFQIWLNLPAANKMADPYFTMLWGDDLPRITNTDERGSTSLTVVAGALGGRPAPAPPPDSWAARADADVAIWMGSMDAGTSLELPPAEHPDTVRTLYLYDGAGLRIGGTPVGPRSASVVRPDVAVMLDADAGPVEFLVLQGRPIAEPVAQYGPFVMNDRAGIEQAVEDYRRTGFGGWPWPADDPTHGAEPSRFARHADGRIERREDAPA